jgi:hypothetical protein
VAGQPSFFKKASTANMQDVEVRGTSWHRLDTLTIYREMENENVTSASGSSFFIKLHSLWVAPSLLTSRLRGHMGKQKLFFITLETGDDKSNNVTNQKNFYRNLKKMLKICSMVKPLNGIHELLNYT